ncbi:MAG TPA: TonB family protein, partial [Vicinamibacteria bacterium]|nr:TonB family protein [Vicinamibacteria bacterium]
YAPAGLTLEVRNGEPLLPLRFVMEPLTAKLRVRSEPADALVRLDGQPMGTTPLDSVDLTPGRHEVRLERRGYASASQVVDGRAGETVDVSLRLHHEAPDSLSTPAPPLAEGDLVPLDATVVQPRKVSKNDSPSYPREAERQRLQGSVTVDILVDENGRVQDPHVVESAGTVLDRAVLSALSGWRYEPARKNGVKVKVRMQVRTTFKQP